MYRCQRCGEVEGPRKPRKTVYIYRKKVYLPQTSGEVARQCTSRLEIEREITLCHECYDKVSKIPTTPKGGK